ncbi:MAG: flavodoxin domain-containing protein [Candidatus Bathyarchaeota archaeon]|nr:flavodoxin domain-containing protein [Candidatus Bathyarchaeota archaeon]
MKALVLYHSQEFGNTGKMAEAVAQGLRDEGLDVTLFNTDESRYPINEFAEYSCVAFGTPDYYSYPAGTLKTFMDDHYIARVRKGVKNLQGKPYALFYSHGGGGKVKPAMINMFSYVGNQIGEPVESYGAPDQKTLEDCKALGKELAEATK